MTRPDRKARKLQEQCDVFNASTPVGGEVRVRLDSGANVLTTTTSEAQVLSGHTAVIWVKGISGCYLLDRVSKVIAAFEKRDGKLVQRALMQDSPEGEPTSTAHPKTQTARTSQANNSTGDNP